MSFEHGRNIWRYHCNLLSQNREKIDENVSTLGPLGIITSPWDLLYSSQQFCYRFSEDPDMEDI